MVRWNVGFGLGESGNIGIYNSIRDFSGAEDRIDISALLTGDDPVSDAISDFVRITTNKK